MKRAGKIFIWVAGTYVVLVMGSGLLIKTLLTRGRIDAVVHSLNARMPVAVSVAEGSFDLLQWFRFQPVISLKKISVANPAGFSAEPLLVVGEAGAQVALLSLFERDIRVPQVDLHEPTLNIETDAKGNTNLTVLLAAAAKDGQGQGVAGGTSPGKGVSIDRVSLTGGTIRYQENGAAPGLTVRDIQLFVSDFGAGRSAKLTLDARLFGGKASRLGFKGQAGPAGAESLPAQGDLSLVLAPAEISKPLREQYLGDLLGEPPAGAKISFTAGMKGDLMKSLEGAGDLRFTDFAIGRSRDNRVPLSGTAPFRVSLRRPLGSPAVSVSALAASLQLGQGRWKGSLAARHDRSHFAGESSGSITGIRIEEMLRAFTTTKESVSGLAEIPEYRLHFAGKNAAELRNSLTGAGAISLRDGKVSLFDLLGTIEAKLNGVLGGDGGKPGTTDFLKLASRFEIKSGQVTFSDLALQNSSSAVSGQGYATFDHALSFDLMTDTAGGLATRFGGKPDAAGVAHLRVPVKVRGTMESPKVYPDVTGMAKAAAVDKAKGLIDSFLNKRGAGQSK